MGSRDRRTTRSSRRAQARMPCPSRAAARRRNRSTGESLFTPWQAGGDTLPPACRCEGGGKMDAKDPVSSEELAVFQTQVDLVNSERETMWARHNAMLVANSLILSALAI